MNFKDRNAHSTPLFIDSNIIKFPDKIKIENCLLINKYFHNKLPSTFNSWFNLSSNCHNYETSFSSKGNLKVPMANTTSYGKASFINMAVKTWNDIQKDHRKGPLVSYSLKNLKQLLNEYFLTSYKTSNI